VIFAVHAYGIDVLVPQADRDLIDHFPLILARTYAQHLIQLFDVIEHP